MDGTRQYFKLWVILSFWKDTMWNWDGRRRIKPGYCEYMDVKSLIVFNFFILNSKLWDFIFLYKFQLLRNWVKKNSAYTMQHYIILRGNEGVILQGIRVAYSIFGDTMDLRFFFKLIWKQNGIAMKKIKS